MKAAGSMKAAFSQPLGDLRATNQFAGLRVRQCIDPSDWHSATTWKAAAPTAQIINSIFADQMFSVDALHRDFAVAGNILHVKKPLQGAVPSTYATLRNVAQSKTGRHPSQKGKHRKHMFFL
jgi:hypothetical protein